MSPMGAGVRVQHSPRQCSYHTPCPLAAAGWVTSSSPEAHRVQPPAQSPVPLQDLLHLMLPLPPRDRSCVKHMLSTSHFHCSCSSFDHKLLLLSHPRRAAFHPLPRSQRKGRPRIWVCAHQIHQSQHKPCTLALPPLLGPISPAKEHPNGQGQAPLGALPLQGLTKIPPEEQMHRPCCCWRRRSAAKSL